jgi:hypothetical protein
MPSDSASDRRETRRGRGFTSLAAALYVGLLALMPLALLLFTGLYLFVLPDATRWRRGWRTGGAVLE